MMKENKKITNCNNNKKQPVKKQTLAIKQTSVAKNTKKPIKTHETKQQIKQTHLIHSKGQADRMEVQQMMRNRMRIHRAKYQVPLNQVTDIIVISQNLKPAILRRIKTVDQIKIRLRHDQYYPLLNQIVHIQFTKTMFLNLAYCNIFNIQSIAYLNCPKLRQLQLHGNHITNLQPLMRNNQLRWLEVLSVYENPLWRQWKVQRGYMNKLLKYIMNNNKESSVEDLSFLAKNPGKNVNMVYVRACPLRINQLKITDKFKQFKPQQNSK